VVRKFLVTLTQGEDGYIIAECPALPGCASQGKTKDEALDNIREAILLTLETQEAQGSPISPRETEVAEVQVSL